MNWTQAAFILLLLSFVQTPSSAGTTETKTQSVACEIFRKRGDWYEAARQTEVRWGIPAAYQLALLTEEWDLKSGRIPAKWRTSIWFSPNNPSLPQGYFDSTWKQYKYQTGQTNVSPKDIYNVLDFMGWYIATLSMKQGLTPYDAAGQYVLWRHGPDAYVSGEWQSNVWMKLQADAFAKRARDFETSLASCTEELDKTWASKLMSIGRPWSWKSKSNDGRKGYGKPGYAPNAISSK